MVNSSKNKAKNSSRKSTTSKSRAKSSGSKPATPRATKKKKLRGRITQGSSVGPIVGRHERRIAQNSNVKTRRKVLSIRELEKLSEDELLETRICDLGVSVESEWLKPKLEKLYEELSRRGIRFKPHAWLSDEWFSPDGIPGIAIPFCLAHPRLKSLERKQMHEIEGGTATWCMKILRHEAGHTLDTAYRFYRRPRYKKTFGNYHDPYPDSYRPKPDSKKFVLHLEPWYAQSHPAEDFAETFAVWLRARSSWQKEYEGWPALNKLDLVEQMIQSVQGKAVKLRSRAKVDPITRNKITLREHYQQRHASYTNRRPMSFDHDLKRLFPAKSITKNKRTTSAATFLQRNRGELSRVVAQWTGEYRYNVSQVLREMIDRCRELDLRVSGSSADVKQRAMVMLTVQTMNYLHGGHHRVAL